MFDPSTSADELSQEDAGPFRGLPIDRIGLVLGPAALIAWIYYGPQGSLSGEAHRLSGILLLTIIWWLTEPIPIPATGLLAVVLSVFLRAVPSEGASGGSFQPAKIVLSPFADPSVYFLFGGMFIGRAMTRHGLDRRLALSVLCTRWAGRTPATVLLGVGLSVCLVSMWISNTAATAMIYPVTIGIISVLAAASGSRSESFARSPYASMLLLMTAYASSVGGIATPIGTATNVVAMGFFRRPEYLNQSIDFLRWCAVGVPLMAVIFVGLFTWLRMGTHTSGLNMPALRAYLSDERARLGPWRRGEKNTLAVFLIVAGLWVTPGILALVAPRPVHEWFTQRFPEEVVALLAPILLFLLPVDWSRRRFSLDVSDFQHIDWGTMILFGAGLSLGSLMFKTGLASAIGQQAFDWLGTDDVWSITALAIVGGIVLSEFTSNAATASTLIPVVWAICQTAKIDNPLPPLMGVTLAASFGSALPVSTPPNAIVYGSGLLPVKRMVLAGLGVDVIAGLAIWLTLRVAFGLGWSPVL
jgi:solute carrier family 13 (sodium-dependent dicarboxylate transporter), member 2/3/5